MKAAALAHVPRGGVPPAQNWVVLRDALRLLGSAFPCEIEARVSAALLQRDRLVVGMEIRREIHEGALSNLKQAMLPIAAALGGIIAPALIYIAINRHPILRQGWTVSTATDIAFAIGVLALLGRSIPANIRVFLLALAIIDDVVARDLGRKRQNWPSFGGTMSTGRSVCRAARSRLALLQEI
jgi:hypothetical protein